MLQLPNDFPFDSGRTSINLAAVTTTTHSKRTLNVLPSVLPAVP
jgi:hypothetical protein